MVGAGAVVGAAGAVEMIVCAKAIQNDIVPPTINYQTPDPELDLDYTPNAARDARIDRVMINGFGFGGQNAVAIFQRFAE